MPVPKKVVPSFKYPVSSHFPLRSIGGDVLGRITLPFRTIFREEMKDLKSFRDALTDPSRRDAFGSLKRAWSGEMGAMSYARVPSVLSLMYLDDLYFTSEDTVDAIGDSELSATWDEMVDALAAEDYALWDQKFAALMERLNTIIQSDLRKLDTILAS